MKETDVLQHAIEVFARGFCFTRSFTHPYLAERLGKVWVVRDGPRKGWAATVERNGSHTG